MAAFEEKQLNADNPDKRALLYVSDSVSDTPEFVAFAIKLAEKHGASLELLHVIDPGQTPSTPDAHMGTQFSLEVLARTLKALKRNAHALLLFGCPEEVISKRAAAIQATLIAFPLDGSAKDRKKKNLAQRLIRKCACPVLTFSLFSATAMRSDARCPQPIR